MGRAGRYTVEIKSEIPESLAVQEHTLLGAIKLGPFPAIPERVTSATRGPIGAQLRDYLFASRLVRDAMVKAQTISKREHRPLHLQLDLGGNAQLQRAPWELIVDFEKQQPLALEPTISVSRFLSSESFDQFRPSRLDTLRALVVIASPRDAEEEGWPPIDVEREVSIAQEALSGASFVPLTRALQGRGVTLDSIRQRLDDRATLADGRHFDLLYLVAHGKADRDGGLLVLEDEQGNADYVDSTTFAMQLSRVVRRPLLVVLNSCETAGRTSASVSTLSAVAPQLVTKSGIPAVIAMQQRLTFDAAGLCMPVLLRQLCQHGNIIQALAAARQRLDSAEQAEWWVPVLFLRAHHGQLFLPGAALSPTRNVRSQPPAPTPLVVRRTRPLEDVRLQAQEKRAAGDLEGALALLRKSLHDAKRAQPQAPVALATIHRDLGALHVDRSSIALALDAFGQSLTALAGAAPSAAARSVLNALVEPGGQLSPELILAALGPPEGTAENSALVATTLIERAKANIAQQAWEAALSDLTVAIDLLEDTEEATAMGDALRLAAIVYRERGERDRFLELVDQALAQYTIEDTTEAQRGGRQALGNRALDCIAWGLPERAIEDLEKWLDTSLTVDQPDILLNLAIAYTDAGRFTEAHAAAEQSLALAMEQKDAVGQLMAYAATAEVWRDRAREAVRAQEASRAREMVELALAAGHLGIGLVKRERPRRSGRSWDREVAPSFFDIHRILADAYLDIRNNEECDAYIEEAARLADSGAVEPQTQAKLLVTRARRVVAGALTPDQWARWIGGEAPDASPPAPLSQEVAQAAQALLAEAAEALTQAEEWKELVPVLVLQAQSALWSGDARAALAPLRIARSTILEGRCPLYRPIVLALFDEARRRSRPVE